MIPERNTNRGTSWWIAGSFYEKKYWKSKKSKKDLLKTQEEFFWLNS